MDGVPEHPDAEALRRQLDLLRVRIDRQEQSLSDSRLEIHRLSRAIEALAKLPSEAAKTPMKGPTSAAERPVPDGTPPTAPPAPVSIPPPVPPPFEGKPAMAVQPPAPREPRITEGERASKTVQAAEAKPAGASMDLETRIGTYWFNRIGMVSLVIAFALFSRYIHAMLMPIHKVGLLYLGAGLVYGVGRFFEDRFESVARPVMAGGISLAFLTSYAAHFVPATACFSLPVSLGLMLGSAVLVLIRAERWRSEATAGLALLLGHVAILTAGQDVGTFTVWAIVVLSTIAFVLMQRHPWYGLGLGALCAAFASHSLWAIRQTGVFGFHDGSLWWHLPGLTAYYVIFTAAAFRHLATMPPNADSGLPSRQRFAGRALGPVAMILYATLALVVFAGDAQARDGMHWFLLSFALVQWGQAVYLRTHRSRDAGVYLAAGVVFLTLGLFAWVEGMTLNLALAAEALLLLIFARRLDLWILNPLAQVVIGVNFVQFWMSDAHLLATWPDFLGAVASASVYLVKARMEETWPPAKTRTGVPTWLNELPRRLAVVMRPLSLVHAVAGGFLLAHHADAFFPVAERATAICVFLAVLFAAMAVWQSRPWFVAAAILLGALVVEVLAMPSPSWAGQGTTWFVILAGCALLAEGRRRPSPLLSVTGIVSLLFAVPIVYWVTRSGQVMSPAGFALVLTPGIYWVVADWLKPWARVSEPGAVPALENWVLDNLATLRPLLAVIAAILTHTAVLGVVESPSSARWGLACLGWVILAATVYRSSPDLGFGLVVFQVINLVGLFLGFRTPLATEPLLVWWTGVGAAGAACILQVAGIRHHRASFLSFGLVILVGVPGLMGVLLANEQIPFQPLAPWLFLLALYWAAIEIFRAGLRDLSPNPADWKDVEGRRFLQSHRLLVAALFSIAGSLALIGVLAVRAESAFMFWRAETLVAVVFLAGAAALRSPTLGIGAAAGFVAAHLGFVAGASATDSFAHPVWAWFLIGLSLAVGAGAEWVARRIPDDTSGLRAWLLRAAWYGVLVSQGLGALFLIDRVGRVDVAPVAAIPIALVLAPLSCLIGTRLRLFATATSAAALSLAATVAMIGIPLVDAEYQSSLHLAAIGVAIQFVMLERMLARLSIRLPERQALLNLVRRCYAVAGAALLLFAFHSSAEVRDAWTTLGWSVSALVYLTLGFLVRFSAYRRAGLVMFIACIARVLLVDLAGLEAFYRMIAFLALGVCLVGASFLYSRYRDEIRKWL